MNTDCLDHFIHLHRNPNLDPELLGPALAVKQISGLITNGGSHFGHPESQSSVTPQVIKQYIDRSRKKNGPFDDYWQQLHTEIVQLTQVWERGQGQFQKDLDDARENDEMHLLLSEQSVRVHYADAIAQHLYWSEYPRKLWFLNGYMMAWREWCEKSKETQSA